MSSRIAFIESDDRSDTKAKKKYELSLKNKKITAHDNAANSNFVHKQEDIFFKARTETNNSTDSQSFLLRLSDSFIADDTQEKTRKDGIGKAAKNTGASDVILISDSSDDEILKEYEQANAKSIVSTKKNQFISNEVYIVQSSDSEQEERLKTQDTCGERQWRQTKTTKLASSNGQQRKCSILYTSDETFSDLELEKLQNSKENCSEPRATPAAEKIIPDSDDSIFSFNKLRGVLTENSSNVNITRNLKERNRRIEPTKRSVTSEEFIDDTENSNNLKKTISRLEASRQTPDMGIISKTPEYPKITTKDTGSGRSVNEINRKIRESERTLMSAKLNRTTVLSNKDARKILKIVKSKRAVFESPKQWTKIRNSNESDIDSGDDEVSSPESNVDSTENTKARNGVVIAETDSDSEDPVIRGTRVDLAKPYKTHVKRFLEPIMGIDSQDTMSERKKLEIAQWLMTNTTDTGSETSISNIPASNKNSPSSGNSSLERLETNYETPNNRDRMRKINTSEKSKTRTTNSTKSTKSIRQTRIDDFVRKTADGTQKILTPIAPVREKEPISFATKEATKDLGILDCADILDNLYGNAWRSKADVLLPTTEPRKKNVALHDKGVQTEKKVNSKVTRVKGTSNNSSLEENFETFVRRIKPNFNSTKKSEGQGNRRRCSFIKDSSSSAESDCETTYLTALTNPRISNNHQKITGAKPLSENIRRVIAICDSDTEDESDKFTNTRKVLTFTDDESNSSTSEYDPNDIIPPKSTAHTAPKPTRNGKKSTKIPTPISNAKISRTRNSFLASLSAAIPLNEAHPEAKKYRQNYKNTKEELCKYLYKLYNENIFDSKLPIDMSIEWNVRMRGTAGFCYNKRSVKALSGITRSSRIVLATKIVDTPDRLRDTLVHEMCHAAAWLINDVSDGHGPFWKGWANKAMKTFPELPPIKRCHDYKITTKFTYRCTACGYSIGRHSKSLDIEKKRCGHCYGKFELLRNKVTKSGVVEKQAPTSKKPTAFALFVKENYSVLKKNRKDVPHKEIMQILGQQFSAVKISAKKSDSNENAINKPSI